MIDLHADVLPAAAERCGCGTDRCGDGDCRLRGDDWDMRYELARKKGRVVEEEIMSITKRKYELFAGVDESSLLRES